MEVKGYMEQGVANRGNWYRIKECMKMAREGKHVNIGFLGGSITQGSLATDDSKCYAYLVYEWWKKTFPNTEFTYMNAGIGATTSHYAAARAQKDLLDGFPNFVIIDFSVNDDANTFYMETFEGVVRNIVKRDDTAVLILNNVFYDTGKNAEEFHNQIARKYQIPCISMKSSLYRMIEDGLYKRRDITPDDLHPNDLGHQLVAQTITSFLSQVHQQLDVADMKNEYPDAVTENAYEHAKLLQSTNYDALLDGFEVDKAEKEGMRDLFKNGWCASKVGDRIQFEFEGSCLAVQYLKSVNHPVPIAEAVVDGDSEHKIRLDGNFDETWGDYLCLESILHHGTYGKHTLDITIVQAEKDIVRPFYLVALVIA